MRLLLHADSTMFCGNGEGERSHTTSDLKDICYSILTMLKYVQYYAYSVFYAWAIHL